MTDSFSALGVSEDVSSALAGLGITEPFAVQRMCIPAALAGDDVIAKSPTGQRQDARVRAAARDAGRSRRDRPRGARALPDP